MRRRGFKVMQGQVSELGCLSEVYSVVLWVSGEKREKGVAGPTLLEGRCGLRYGRDAGTWRRGEASDFKVSVVGVCKCSE